MGAALFPSIYPSIYYLSIFFFLFLSVTISLHFSIVALTGVDGVDTNTNILEDTTLNALSPSPQSQYHARHFAEHKWHIDGNETATKITVAATMVIENRITGVTAGKKKKTTEFERNQNTETLRADNLIKHRIIYWHFQEIVASNNDNVDDDDNNRKRNRKKWITNEIDEFAVHSNG